MIVRECRYTGYVIVLTVKLYFETDRNEFGI